MSKLTVRKHHVDIMFLMILFLIFTFSAVSVLLMAIRSYKSVVNSSESNASARVLSAYVREVVHQHDANGAVTLDYLDGCECIKIDEGQGYYIYIYAYDGYLMELNASDDSQATADFGDKIAPIKEMKLEEKADGAILEVSISDNYENVQKSDIAIKSTNMATKGQQDLEVADED